MEQQSDQQCQLRNQDSFIQNKSQNLQIDSLSNRSKSNSFGVQRSIIQVQDIKQNHRKSFIQGSQSQQDLQQSSKVIRLSIHSSKDFQPPIQGQCNLFLKYAEKYSIQHHCQDNFIQNINSESRHQCTCQKNSCNDQACPCVLSINQQCYIGLCCSNCIQKKKRFLTKEQQNALGQKQKKPRQQINKRDKSYLKAIKKMIKARIQKQKYDFVYCTCKKTQCLKKYCPCYAGNKKCNQCCICDQCQNKSDQQQSQDNEINNKNGKVEIGKENNQVDENKQLEKKQMINELMMEQEIDNYFEDSPLNYDDVQLHKVMDFEPIDLGEYLK